MYYPDWLFFVPGIILFLIGLIFSVILTITPITIGNVSFDINTLVFTILLVIVGSSIISTGVITKVFAEQSGYIPHNADSIIRKITAERGTLFGMIFVLLGTIGEIFAVVAWSRTSFGELNTNFLRFTLPPFAFIAIGIQMISTSFLADIIRIKRKNNKNE
jgi:hypothetical protein